MLIPVKKRFAYESKYICIGNALTVLAEQR